MIDLADGNAVGFAETAAPGGAGLGACGFGTAGTWGVCAKVRPEANVTTRTTAVSVATPARDKVTLGIQELQQSTRTINQFFLVMLVTTPTM
jgi:hypothetical protein